MIQPKFTGFRFISQAEDEFLRKLLRIACRGDGTIKNTITGVEMTTRYGAWNYKKSYEVWLESGIIEYITEKSEVGYRSKFLLDIESVLRTISLLDHCRYFGFYGVERDIVRLVNLSMEQGRPLVASDNYFLLTKYVSLKPYLTDSEPCIISKPNGVGNGRDYSPTIKGECVRDAWVNFSEWMDECFHKQGKTWTRVV